MTKLITPEQAKPELTTADLTALGINLDNYLGLWAIEESAFQQQYDMFRSMNLSAHIASATPSSLARQQAASQSQADGSGIVQIDIRGTMTKQGSSLSGAGSTVRIRQAVREAQMSADVSAVLFVVDTPGGTVAGTSDLGDEIAKLTAVKPTMTFVEDLMASAGLWVGVQTRKVFANASNAIVGSMGVFIGLYDLSGFAAKEGIRPVVIKTGELKGAGFPGAEVTDAQKAMWQGLADESFAGFTAAIKRGRPSITADQLKELSRAGVYPAQQAIGLGLIDGIRSYDDALSELRSMIPSSKRKGTAKMSDEQPKAATLSQLKLACDGAPADFLLSQLETEATVEAAQRQWSRQQNAKILELEGKVKAGDDALAKLKADTDKQLADLNVKLADAEARAKARGAVNPVGDGAGAGAGGGSGAGTATERWNDARSVLVKSGMTSQEATMKLAADQPELHKAYLEEVNANRK
jgi:protease-4